MSFDRTHLPEAVGYFEEQGLVLTGPSRAKWRTTAFTFHGGSDSMLVAAHLNTTLSGLVAAVAQLHQVAKSPQCQEWQAA